VIARGHSEYWGGEGWVPLRQQALLYAHSSLVKADCDRLRREEAKDAEDAT